MRFPRPGGSFPYCRRPGNCAAVWRRRRRRGITALTRISEGFPQRLRLLGRDCPPALFCRGDRGLLETACVALVGARALSPRSRRFAQHIGRLAALEGYTLVSGGAAGADTAAQEACLAAGGRVIVFLPDELIRHAPRERVLFCSEEGERVAFSAARALRRNRLIHALGEKTFVAQCAAPSGGTWSGASENLRRGLSPVFILDEDSEGCRALVGLGALPVGETPASIRELRPLQLSIFDDVENGKRKI